MVSEIVEVWNYNSSNKPKWSLKTRAAWSGSDVAIFIHSGLYTQRSPSTLLQFPNKYLVLFTPPPPPLPPSPPSFTQAYFHAFSRIALKAGLSCKDPLGCAALCRGSDVWRKWCMWLRGRSVFSWPSCAFGPEVHYSYMHAVHTVHISKYMESLCKRKTRARTSRS